MTVGAPEGEGEYHPRPLSVAIVGVVPRQCQRPDCFEPASVAYSFDASRQLVVLDALDDDDRVGSVLCARHAQAMVLPKGWWLDDQRVTTPTLFTAGRAAALEATSSSVSHRPRRRREPTSPASDEPVLPIAAPAAPAEAPAAAPAAAPLEQEPEPVAMPAVAVAEVPTVDPPAPEPVTAEEAQPEPPTPAWTPNFDSVEDMGLLQADSPLLSRAFGAKGSQGARRRRAK